MGFETDPEVRRAVEDTALTLAEMGHEVEQASPKVDGLAAMRAMMDLWFFGFDLRLAGFSKRSGHAIGPHTLEPVVFRIYEYARQMKPATFLASMALPQHGAPRRWAPTSRATTCGSHPRRRAVSEPWGNYNLGRERRLVRGDAREAASPGRAVHAAAQHHGNTGDLAAARDAFGTDCPSACSSERGPPMST